MGDGFCYVAKKVGWPGAYAACSDNPEYAKDTAKFVAAEIKRGASVERVPTEDARSLLSVFIKWKLEQQKPKRLRTPSTGTKHG